MLSAQEHAQLLELQEKAKGQYIPLADKDLLEIEKRAREQINQGMFFIPHLTQILRKFHDISGILASDNMRLIQEIQHHRLTMVINADQLPGDKPELIEPDKL